MTLSSSRTTTTRCTGPVHNGACRLIIHQRIACSACPHVHYVLMSIVLALFPSPLQLFIYSSQVFISPDGTSHYYKVHPDRPLPGPEPLPCPPGPDERSACNEHWGAVHRHVCATWVCRSSSRASPCHPPQDFDIMTAPKWPHNGPTMAPQWPHSDLIGVRDECTQCQLGLAPEQALQQRGL